MEVSLHFAGHLKVGVVSHPLVGLAPGLVFDAEVLQRLETFNPDLHVRVVDD